jgi:hypothetical protein
MVDYIGSRKPMRHARRGSLGLGVMQAGISIPAARFPLNVMMRL